MLDIMNGDQEFSKKNIGHFIKNIEQYKINIFGRFFFKFVTFFWSFYCPDIEVKLLKNS